MRKEWIALLGDGKWILARKKTKNERKDFHRCVFLLSAIRCVTLLAGLAVAAWTLVNLDIWKLLAIGAFALLFGLFYWPER